VAPAGYGKTTLARQWLADKPHVWHSATAASADVAALAARLAEAGSRFTASDLNTFDERLHLSRDPEKEVEVLVDFVARCFAGSRTAWLAIDDYHLLMESPAAEEMVAALPESAPFRLLVTSRHRPSWASARHLMYGDIDEIGRDDLAMDATEAHEVLERHLSSAAPRIVALADGWPAVIGMAALTDATVAPDNAIDEALYDFFAQEFFNTVDAETQELLCRVAVLPTVKRTTCIALFGQTSLERIRLAERLGLLSRTGADWQIHPLLRKYLLMRYSERDPEGIADAARSAFEIAVRTRDWDTAFSLASEFEMTDLIEDVIRASLDDLLSVGRLATLRKWVDAANVPARSSPAVRLAEAEVAFREGNHLGAEVLANAAVHELSDDDPLSARAFFRIGQAAYFNEHYEEALNNFDRCVSASGADQNLEREARWAAFIAALDSYHPDTDEYLRAFARVREPTVNDAVRTANAELMIAMRQQGVREALDAHSGAIHLVGRATDPMIRTAFWNAYGWALALNSRYDEAKRAAASELEDAEAYRLSFVEPHAQLLAALAAIGVRELAAGEAFLSSVFQFALRHDDVFLSVNGSAVLARLHIARGDNARAAEATGAFRAARRSILHAEYLGIRSVVLAALGENKGARNAITAVPEQASHGEGLAFAQLAAVILASNENKNPLQLAGEAIAKIRALGQLDVFVTACRAYPPLIGLAISSGNHDFAQEVLGRSNDFDLANHFDLKIPTNGTKTDSPLSRREQQVLDLVAEGRTNEEVARQLFISPVTVKAHLRHIYEKLGVRNRVEAARLSKH
jgi:LuxR family transcriptional regulator, maltose regulon positive regulatory protein